MDKWIAEKIRELDKGKVGAEVFHAVNQGYRIELKGIRDTLARIRFEVSRSHNCTQGDVIGMLKEDISKIDKTLNGWKNIRLGLAVTIIIVITGALGQWFMVKDSVDDTVATVKTLQSSITEIQIEQKKQKKLEDSERLERMERMMEKISRDDESWQQQ